MTLSEIELTLEDLRKRHQELTPSLLVTLLQAAGWEEKDIKDATLLDSKNQTRSSPERVSVVSEVPQQEVSSSQEKIVFYTPDGQEEKEVHVKDDIPEKKREEKMEHPVPAAFVQEVPPTKIENIVTEEVHIVSPQTSSLITPKETTPSKKEVELPENLPLRPFESSPHVWSFSQYKEIFHKENTPPQPPVPPVVPPKPEPQIVYVQVPVPSIPQIETMPQIEEEIVAEKVPMNKEDQSLVFLASVMLLGIILILGYMYGNGRL